MRFEVVKNGQILCSTEYAECIYSEATLRTISKAGYSFRIDGKRASLDTVLNTNKKK